MEEFRLDLPDSEISYCPYFLSSDEANRYFGLFMKTVPWQQDAISVFGKTYPQPRLTALYGDNDKPYSYSNITMRPHKFTPELLLLKEKLEHRVQTRFTSCLLNLYRNGRDSNGWHADNEKELGRNPIIASLSLGQERTFQLKHRKNKNLKHKMILGNGSLLIMQGATQHHWLHQVPKTLKDVGPRINLTFRIIR
ncbi:alpha-ketoglutarate-dependent dioxygenase AlkB [Flavobacteriaceae bacterium 3-367]|uniref:alpha-ketoglutarate-dependent dioxygenase AlkB family protein n=1 Tax=Eudoraea algarum TaxID=3417568 RepID=UPI00327B88CB